MDENKTPFWTITVETNATIKVTFQTSFSPLSLFLFFRNRLCSSLGRVVKVVFIAGEICLGEIVTISFFLICDGTKYWLVSGSWIIMLFGQIFNKHKDLFLQGNGWVVIDSYCLKYRINSLVLVSTYLSIWYQCFWPPRKGFRLWDWLYSNILNKHTNAVLSTNFTISTSFSSSRWIHNL